MCFFFVEDWNLLQVTPPRFWWIDLKLATTICVALGRQGGRLATTGNFVPSITSGLCTSAKGPDRIYFFS
jgi:hypothetical protein